MEIAECHRCSDEHAKELVTGCQITEADKIVCHISINVFKLYYGDDWEGLFEAITGYGLGGSSTALFERVGGGIYTKGANVGIRIENLLVVREVEPPNRFGGITYLGVEKLTFVPIQSKLLDLSLMSAAEIDRLNNYHSEVWGKVSPLVDRDAHEWLWRNTRPVSKHCAA